MPLGEPTAASTQHSASGASAVGRAGRRELAASLAMLVGFYFVTTSYLRPVWRLWRTQIAQNQGDPVFNLYLLKWVGHEWGRRFAGFWDAPFFFPTRGVLAYSDHMLGPGLVAAAWQAVVPGWVGTYNLLFLSAFAWTGWTMSWVLRRSGRTWAAAFLGGLIYAFCPFRWDQISHLQVLLMAAIPLTLWTFDRLLAEVSWARAAGFLLCYAVHLAGGCYLAAMIQFPLLILAGNRAMALWRSRRAIGIDGFAVLATTAAAAAGLLGATFFEYRRVAARDGLTWDAGTERHWGASLLSYLQPSDFNLYATLWPRSLFRSENCLFPGFLAVALCAAGAWHLLHRSTALDDAPRVRRHPAKVWRLAPLALVILGWTGGELLTWGEVPRFAALARWVPWNSYRLPFALVVSGAALWLVFTRRLTGRWSGAWIAALDPWPRGLLLAGIATALLSTPLFYLPLSHVLPGLSSMRVPARFQAFTMLVIAFFAAAAFDACAKRLRTAAGASARWRAAALTIAVLALALVECAPQRLPWGPLPDEAAFPSVYTWLAGQSDIRALVELPLTDPTVPVGGTAALQAMYFGTRHWRPVVNGYSAHFPPDYRRLESTCCDPAPDDATISELESRGVSHILVHRDRLRRWQRHALAAWAAADASRHEIELVYADDSDSVYRLAAAAESRPGTAASLPLPIAPKPRPPTAAAPCSSRRPGP